MAESHSLKIYGVLGYPAKHSLSPLMHNAAFKALKIDAEYRIFEIEQVELGGFLKSLSDKNIHGLNVTVPYKEAVIKYLQWESAEVRFTQAANTIIVKKDNYLEGWNTDGLGFHRHLTEDLKFSLPGKHVIMLGAGGAAKSVVDQLARKGAKIIEIFDVDKDKCLRLTEKLSLEFLECKTTAVDSPDAMDFKNADLLINATPVGMKQDDKCLVDANKLHSRLLVYDLIYNPAETKLLKMAREKGAKVSNGLGMLLYQGALSFELWTGKKAPIGVMRNALNEGVKKL